MKFILIVTCIAAIFLFFYPTYSSFIFRVNGFIFDSDMWRGFYESDPLSGSCACVSSNNNNNNKHLSRHLPLFTFKVLKKSEILKRRFCSSIRMKLPALQIFFVHAMRSSRKIIHHLFLIQDFQKKTQQFFF